MCGIGGIGGLFSCLPYYRARVALLRKFCNKDITTPRKSALKFRHDFLTSGKSAPKLRHDFPPSGWSVPNLVCLFTPPGIEKRSDCSRNRSLPFITILKYLMFLLSSFQCGCEALYPLRESIDIVNGSTLGNPFVVW